MKFLARWRSRKTAVDRRTVYMSERYGVRSLHIGSDTIQSSMRIARPLELELAYTRSMMAFLLFVPPPREVLMIGLGGGSLAKFLHHRLPHTRVKAVEVNPQVVALARQYFEVPRDGANFEVIVADGAEYVSRAEVKADVMLIDGYEADSYVEALASETFYADCLRRLRRCGMLVVNLWGSDRTFETLLQRISTTSDGRTLCLPAERPGNIIVLAFAHAPAMFRWCDLEARADALHQRYGLEFPRFVEGFRKMNRYDDLMLYPGGFSSFSKYEKIVARDQFMG
jgi:spermidine synthase